MKRAILSIILLCTLLIGCNTNTTTADNSKPSSEIEVDEISDVSTISQKNSDNSTFVEEKLLSIVPDASVYESDGSISIDFTETYEKFSADLIYDCARIIGTSEFSEEYSGLSFSFLKDDLSFFLTVSDFQDISDYTTTLICTGKDVNQVAAVKTLYNKLFFNHDSGNKQLIEQGKIAEKYGVDGGDSTASLAPEDELWFYSFFDGEIPFSFENGTLAVNYRYDTDNFFQYGYDVYTDLETSTSQFKVYFANSPLLITSNKLIFICFDGQTDTRLCEFIYDKTENDTFKLSVNYFNDDFREGVLKKYNELK